MEWIGGVLCFSLGSRLRGNDVGVRGNDGGCLGLRCHPHPGPLPSRERGFAVSPSPWPSPIEGEGLRDVVVDAMKARGGIWSGLCA